MTDATRAPGATSSPSTETFTASEPHSGKRRIPAGIRQAIADEHVDIVVINEPKGADLLSDIAAVWPADADYLWLGELADALAERFPGEYPTDARGLSELLTATGAEVKQFARDLDGRPVSRQGVTREGRGGSGDRVTARSAFAAHFAANAPEWFRPDAATMDRLAAAWATMTEVRALLDRIRPDVDRLHELKAAGLGAVEEIDASIPDDVWNATPEMVDGWEIVGQVVDADAALAALNLGQRLAHDPTPIPGTTADTPARPKPSAPTAKPLPPETIAWLVEHGQGVAYPSGAVRDRRDHEGPAIAIHAVHWLQQARQDIAAHGVDWADGHASGLEIAVAEGAWNGQLSSLAAECQGRPDPMAKSSDAWTRDEDAAVRQQDLAAHVAHRASPVAAEPPPLSAVA